jgi:hypothetical protein
MHTTHPTITPLHKFWLLIGYVIKYVVRSMGVFPSTINAAVEHTFWLGLSIGGGGSRSVKRLLVPGAGTGSVICTCPMSEGNTKGKWGIITGGTAVTRTGAARVVGFLPE